MTNTPQPNPIVIAIDGTSASGKSTNARKVAAALGYTYVDTGAMYRTLAWYCLKSNVDIDNPKAVANALRRWKTQLITTEGEVRLLVDDYFPKAEIRTAETSAAVPHVAAVVMEGRDIGTAVFPETDFKYYLDASLTERTRRRTADGVQENLAARDERDSQRAVAPLMVPLGAKVINNSELTSEITSGMILDDIRERMSRS
jgi:cytidylate kinase